MPVHVTAQDSATRLVTKTTDETNVVKLRGSVHPLAQARYDQGPVPDSFPAGRLLLLLNRPPEREVALQKFLRNIHRRGSANYHRWLTPEQFGRHFGAADSDVQAASAWLQSHGFKISKPTKGKQFVEFYGTAGQLRDAFHTEIHEYDVQGGVHYANANDLSIPQALAPLIRGVAALNDFRAQPQLRSLGPASYSRATRKTTPQWTINNPNGNFYALAPEDFATQYNLNPLYQAGVDGKGQTIGIINESNIDLSLVNAYQQLFGLVRNPTQVVIDGNDPGVVPGIDVEAYLDVEVSEAVAPKAAVNLYIASGSPLQDPLALAAIRAVEDNQASVLSLSFGACEANLGNLGNQFWSGLWEQAAAQGQTVLVSSGDSGPVCYVPTGDNFDVGIAVNGLASTPWNVAVGGTDFYYSDYASGAPSAATLWDQTNDSRLGSLKAPLPEQGWSDWFGLDVIIMPFDWAVAGGGGASNCAVESIGGSGVTCTSGYAKPSWQAGAGVPADGARDMPDISLFASNGANLSATPICGQEGECAPGANGEAEILLIGGTSVSSPAMAGIMALINQKYGRQGQANFTFYPLAEQQPNAFHDITLGNNEIYCIPPLTDCIGAATTVYSAAPGYDEATGLGSIDANVLVNNWNSITLLPTSATLSLGSKNVVHGTPVAVIASVAPTSGSGNPTGDVAILTTLPLPAGEGQAVVTLNGGTAKGSIAFLPGGSYNLVARYEGDGVFKSSTSSPVSLTVTPENSDINFQVLSGTALAGTTVGNGDTVPYDKPLSLNIQPAEIGAPAGTTNEKATGTATFTSDSTTTKVPLNAGGAASLTLPALAPGTHTASATYSGDASFKASSGAPVTFTVARGTPYISPDIVAPQLYLPQEDLWYYFANIGSSLTETTVVGPEYYPAPQSHFPAGTLAPTGTVRVCLALVNQGACLYPSYSQIATLSSPSGNYNSLSVATVTFTNLAAGFYFPSVAYSGDATWLPTVWQSLGSPMIVGVAAPPPLAVSTAILNITPASISGGEAATFTTTVIGTPGVGVAPTGNIQYFDNGIFFLGTGLDPANSGVTASRSDQIDPSALWLFWNNGPNQITAIYQGDNNYLPSISNAVDFSVTQSGPDFTLTPQLSQITVKPGSSGTVRLNLASGNANGTLFNDVVTLTCTPSSDKISCSMSPSATTLNEPATATLTVNAASQSSTRSATERRGPNLYAVGSVLMLGLALCGGLADRRPRSAIFTSLCVGILLFATSSCGGGSGAPPPPPPPPPNAAVYNVVVTAAGGGRIHNVKLTVVVQ